MIKIVLVDDYDLVRIGIKCIFEDVVDFLIVCEVKDGEEVVKYCCKYVLDVVFMDLNMFGMGGFEVMCQILCIGENICVIGLLMQKEDLIFMQVIQVGVFGFLIKDVELKEMIDVIYKVVVGQKYLSFEIVQCIVMSKLMLDNDNLFIDLLGRELDIVMCIICGQKVLDIVEQFYIVIKIVNIY